MNNYHIYDENAPKILDLEKAVKYNGRVNVLQPPNQDVHFKMIEKVNIDNKATEYREALHGEFENTVLSELYFSQNNIQIIQNGLKAGVYEMSNQRITIPNQNIDNLKIIMKSIFLQFCNHSTNVTNEISRLNKLVLDDCVPRVYNNALFYNKYLQDVSSIAKPLDRQLHYDREFKQLELKPFI